MEDHHEASFKAEYAKSSRASCKACRGGIQKDSLRLAIMVQSPMFDGKVPNWHHFACFWKKAKARAPTDFHGFDSLRWEDQQKIKDKLGGGGKAGGGGDAVDGGASYGEFAVEYAKSNRSTCRGCQDKIEKDLVRLSRKDYESERAKMYGPQDQWYHVDCFVENREDLEFETHMTPVNIPGYKSLSKEDKDMLIEKLGKGEKKRKATDEGKKAKKAKTGESAEDKALREQSQLVWKIRDALSKDVSNNALKALLEYNEQDIPSGESKLLDRVSDCMAFGGTKPCKECGGQFVYSGSGNCYRCTGNATEWTKCQNTTQKPSRKAFQVPEEFHDVDFLKKYKYVQRARVFPADATPSTSGGPVSSMADADGKLPLSGMKFVIQGKLVSGNKTDVTKTIQRLGGRVVSKIDSKTTACISTEAEVKKASKVIKEAKAADVHVIKDDFLKECTKGGAALLITQHSIADWGSDPHHRIEDVPDGPVKSKSVKMGARQTESMFTKSIPSTLKMKLKGGAAVDPESGLAESGHVLEEKGDIYNAVLGLVDLVRGTNSYYKLQIIEMDKSNSWYIFRAWGRVGTTIGGNKLERCGSKPSAISSFCALYGEKTGNDWSNRSNFTKYPSKFYPLDIDYGAEDDNVKSLNISDAGSRSKLPKSVQDLVKMIFDVESMKKAMLEFEIDLKKMPLGKLSKKQIESAYKVLTELQGLIDNGGSATKFLDASNRFYTLIPHDFGMKKPPLLDTQEVIKSKTDMLANLLDIEVAYSLLKAGDDGAKDPLDVHYEKLKTDIKELERGSDEFKNIEKYVKNTHAATHQQYDLNVLEVWEIDREGEKKRYKPFRDLPNRQLLWHGSRTTNYAGILSQGLRIAPPEAPVTGYMFGKGVYFADMVSKSANYCRTNKSDPQGLMLLCEVALGNMHELGNASYITQLPKGKHSVKGVGMTHPDPKATITTDDGCIIPLGKGCPSSSGHTSLLYNEYIVYDVAQIRMKYLMKMDFKFKW